MRAIREMEAGAREREAQAQRLDERAGELWKAARLEALTVYKGDVIKKTKAGEATYTYWDASWREGDKVKNLYLGYTRKMDKKPAMAKARVWALLIRQNISLYWWQSLFQEGEDDEKSAD